ncbi:MAG: hypothetical protein EBT57_07050 [Verrucomicrobia bacterium]|nr:hypothetical protein [Verrucomicrobiota bacterium]
MAKGKHHKLLGNRGRVHTSRAARGLIRGKTKNSKLRNQGKTARALTRSRNAAVSFRARSR